MNVQEPWFNAAYYAWIPGTLLGILGGLWGTLVGVMAPYGKGKKFIYAFSWTLIAACLALLVAGMVAFVRGQPYGIWYGLGFPGLLGTCLISGLMVVVKQRYQVAEERRINAQDL